MRPISNSAALALATTALAACVAQQAVQSSSPYRPVANVLELMESVVAHSAEEYWGAVSIVVDEDGVTEDFPETDEEWEEVWAAAMSLAESGNLLMMPPRAVDDGDWIRYSQDLVDVGVEAAAAAEARDPERVLEVGERLYNVCVDCHARYVPELPRRVSGLVRPPGSSRPARSRSTRTRRRRRGPYSAGTRKSLTAGGTTSRSTGRGSCGTQSYGRR